MNPEDPPNDYLRCYLPVVEPVGMHPPQSVGLVEEVEVCVSHCEEVGQEGQCEVLSEQSVGLEHAEFAEEGQDDVLFG